MLIVVALAAASGCRRTFAEHKEKPKIDKLCESGMSAAIKSHDGDVIAWRTGYDGVCWIQGRGRFLSRDSVPDAKASNDDRGRLRFTPDERGLTYHVIVPPDVQYKTIRAGYEGTLTIDLATGTHTIVPDEPGADRRYTGNLGPPPPAPVPVTGRLSP